MKQRLINFWNWCKKYWYFTLPVPLIIMWFIFFRKKETGTQSGSGDLNNIQNDYSSIFTDLLTVYPQSFLQQIEKLFRLETAHFTSGQYTQTLTPGMVAVNKVFPYGWSSLDEYAQKNGLSPKDFGIVHFGTTSDGKPRDYIKFPTRYHAVAFTTWFLHTKRNGNVNAWYSLDPVQQQKYASKLAQIKTHYV